MADYTDAQKESATAEMQALIFQDKITRAEWDKLPAYNSDKAVVGGMYRLNNVGAIKKVGPAQFKVFDVIG